MPKPKLNSKKYLPSIRSNSPKRIILFHNSINDIINKFENVQKNQFVLDTKIPIKNPVNYRNDLSIFSENFFSSAQVTKHKVTKTPNKRAKMVDSVSDDIIDGDTESPDEIQIDDEFDDTIESDEIFDSFETNEPHIYDYVPLVNEPITPSTKLMRLRNINIVRYQLNILQRIIGILLSFPFFSSVNGAGLSTLTCAFFMPRFLCENILYPIFRLILGTLYPAYASYKAVRNKDVKDYVSNSSF